MLMILIAIISGVALAAVLFHYASESYGGIGTFSALLAAFLSVGLGLAVIAYAFAGWQWFAAEHEARIINREYGTHYTQAEVFWASDVIDTVRELDRKRVEV